MNKIYRIIVPKNTHQRVKALKHSLKLRTSGNTIEWLLDNQLDKEIIDELEEIRIDNNYDTITEVIKNLISELDEYQSKAVGEK